MAFLKGLTLFASIVLISSQSFSKSGCCSHHGGVSKCDISTGYYQCRDGTQSPSCTCATSGTDHYTPSKLNNSSYSYPSISPSTLTPQGYSTTPMEKKVYIWKDKNGVTNFSDQPKH